VIEKCLVEWGIRLISQLEYLVSNDIVVGEEFGIRSKDSVVDQLLLTLLQQLPMSYNREVQDHAQAVGGPPGVVVNVML
jgi:hypothetical protein